MIPDSVLKCSFLNVPVSLMIETSLQQSDAPPLPNSLEKDLALRILNNLKRIIRTAENVVRSYANAENLELADNIDDPHIWISRDMIEEDGSTQWAFVIGTLDPPAYSYNLDFQGIKYKDIFFVRCCLLL